MVNYTFSIETALAVAQLWQHIMISHMNNEVLACLYLL